MAETRMEAALPPELTHADLRLTQVRGPMTRQVREAFLADGGEGAWEAFLAQVSEPCRRRFAKPIGLYEWVDADLAAELSEAAIAARGEAFIFERGALAAREQLLDLNRWLLRLMNPKLLLANTPRLIRHYYRGGHGAVDWVEDGEAQLSLWAHGYYAAWYEHALTGWLRGGLTLASAKGVEVVHDGPHGEGLEACRHRYSVRWR
ncbi:MAG TPA: hypothetical protein VJ483_04470 [Holophagaceae bacterium]|nr:hypothetical protein [Holophagaceae bacterium]